MGRSGVPLGWIIFAFIALASGGAWVTEGLGWGLRGGLEFLEDAGESLIDAFDNFTDDEAEKPKAGGLVLPATGEE